jgi:hypothetical protein
MRQEYIEKFNINFTLDELICVSDLVRAKLIPIIKSAEGMTGDSEECKLKHKELTFVSDILLKLNNEHLALLRYRKRT